MMNQKHFENGVLVKEVRDGIVITENLGKTPLQISTGELEGRKLSNGSQPPSLLSNLAGAGVRVIQAVVKRERITVSDEEKERRLSICKVCEFYRKGRCLKCGCYINFKTRLETEHCPIGKW